MNVIEVKNLTKSYGKTRAVNGVSFEVKEGEIFGLLGPNGAGKTTTLEILEGLKDPDSGKVTILGHDLQKNQEKIRPQLGIVLQSSGFLPELKLDELIDLFAGLYPESESKRKLIDQFDLSGILDRKYEALSGGQKQRFVLAIALLSRPKIVILDEPTLGLDPAVRQNFWETILGIQKTGITVLLTTHYMEEAEIVCDRVGIIDNGKIVACDRPVKLINSLGIVSRIKFMSSKPVNVGELEQLPGVIAARRDRYAYDLETETPEVSLRELLAWEKNFGGKIFNLQVQQATLDDVFLKMTGHSLRE